MSLVWLIEISALARKQLSKLDKVVTRRIVTFLQERVASNAGPRATGKPLKGELKDYWRYRVGEWRILCEIKDGCVTLLVLHVGHRRDVYK